MNSRRRLATSPRRPRFRAPTAFIACIPESPPETLRQKLDNLLDSIPAAIERYSEKVGSTASEIPSQARQLFAEDGLLGALVFWRENQDSIEATGKALKESGEALIEGDTQRFRQRASSLDLNWLKPKRSLDIDRNQGGSELERRARNVTVFMLESLTPWDFDRHDFGLTFSTVWIDAPPGDQPNDGAYIKMTSTIKPLYGEWKVSARSRLLDLGENASVFGKAGMYLVGDKPAYLGLEADRVWDVAKFSGTKLFANANFRTARLPLTDPIRASVGVQQDFAIGRGFDVTLRIGVNALNRWDWYVTPVPFGVYF